jgi:hypothetical protein
MVRLPKRSGRAFATTPIVRLRRPGEYEGNEAISTESLQRHVAIAEQWMPRLRRKRPAVADPPGHLA